MIFNPRGNASEPKKARFNLSEIKFRILIKIKSRDSLRLKSQESQAKHIFCKDFGRTFGSSKSPYFASGTAGLGVRKEKFSAKFQFAAAKLYL